MQWRQYFKLKEFGLTYYRPQDFVSLQHGPRVLYVVFTSIWLAYHLIWVLLEAYWSLQGSGKWVLLLTNLSYLTLAVFAFVDFVCCLYVFCLRIERTEENNKDLPWYLKLQWILLTICGQAAFQVTVLYWALLAYSSKASSVNKHGINLVYIVMVTLFSAKPMKFQHFYIPMLSSMVYILLNVIYFLASGKILYPFLNWSKPAKATLMSFLFVFVSTPLSYFFMFGLYKLRMFVCERLLKRNEAVDEKDADVLQKFQVGNGFDANRNSTEKYEVVAV